MHSCRNARISILLAAMVVATGCTAINAIDVCERLQEAEGEVNIRRDGDQAILNSSALGAMPDGRALLVFSSEVLANQPERVEVRGIRIDGDAAPMRTCDTQEEAVYAAVDPTGPPVQQRVAAAVATPRAESEAGIVVSLESEADGGDIRVVARALAGNVGCLDPGPGTAVLNADTASPIVGDPVPLNMGNDEFLVLWPAAPPGAEPLSTIGIRGRAWNPAHVDGGFLPLREPATGEVTDVRPVLISATNEQVAAMHACSLSDDRVAIVWSTGQVGGWAVKVGVFSEALETVVEPFVLAEPDPTSRSLGQPQIAFDGSMLLAVWLQDHDGSEPRVHGRFITPDGNYLSTDVAPDGGPFVVSQEAAGDQIEPALVAFADGGFLAAWSETSGGEGDATLRATAFDANGVRQFINRACGRRDFQLGLSAAGRQTGVTLARIADGSIVAAWTSSGGDGTDSSGTSIRATVLRPADLFPVEE